MRMTRRYHVVGIGAVRRGEDRMGRAAARKGATAMRSRPFAPTPWQMTTSCFGAPGCCGAEARSGQTRHPSASCVIGGPMLQQFRRDPSQSIVTSVVTRFAPSPTGFLHLGHARAALIAHRRAREAGGRFCCGSRILTRPEAVRNLRPPSRGPGLARDRAGWSGPPSERPSSRLCRRPGRIAGAGSALRLLLHAGGDRAFGHGPAWSRRAGLSRHLLASPARYRRGPYRDR